MVMTLAAPRVSTTAAREMGRRHRFNALVAMPWARALVGSADPSPHAVSAHAGDGRYRFRPPGGEIASTALLNRHFTVAPKAAVFRVLKYDTLIYLRIPDEARRARRRSSLRSNSIGRAGR